MCGTAYAIYALNAVLTYLNLSYDTLHCITVLLPGLEPLDTLGLV